ncbi:MAG TPA: hypothetical protein VNZ86_02260 [Bacteroidia bacterium]|jgi:hypothetical protein|nr:hypothetical protein [Bacteroidia bacterium]
MKTVTAISALLMVAGQVLAQNETDALRYSQLGFGGTARSSSMAGSFGSLGGDFSTLSSNPAGIGLYRSSEFTITPGLFYQSTTSTYSGVASDDQKQNLNIGNLGLVMTHNLDKENNKEGWKFFQIGVGFNRLANYNSQTTINGVSPTSQMDVWRDQANGTYFTNLDPYSTGGAFNTYLLDTIPGTGGSQYKNALDPGDKVAQSKSIQTSGRYNEWVISFGGNYNNKLFLGGTVGIPTIVYNENTSYTETAVAGNTSSFRSFTASQNLSTTGSGLNIKVGAIYKPLEFLRLGLAFHSKTWFTMTDNWNTTMSSSFSNGAGFTDTPLPGNYNYSLTTPGRIIASAGLVVGKMGMINVDYEYVDYSQSSLSSSDAGVFNDANSAIKSIYTHTNNIRIGGEIKLKPMAIRVGYAYYGSPYSSAGNNDGGRNCYTAGLGFRHNKLFLDLAYILTMSQSNYYLYDAQYMTSTGPAVNNTTTSSYMMTIGYKFTQQDRPRRERRMRPAPRPW